MTYASLTIERETSGQHVVGRPRATDGIGYALRGVFGEAHTLPEDIAQLLRQLDCTPHRLN